MSELPPVIELLKNEMFASSSIDTFFKSAKEFIPELRKQAEWSVGNHDYVDDQAKLSNTEFAVSPISGINPFGQLGKCSELDCRLHSAQNFSRTLGLYSDVIYLPDPFTTLFIEDDETDWTENQLLNLLQETAVLKTLEPLIQAGIIKFISPIKSFCTSCFDKFDQQVSDFTDQAVSEFWNEMSIQYEKEYLVLGTGNLHEPSLVMRRYFDSTLKNKQGNKKAARELFWEIINDEIHEHIMTMYEASRLRSTIFSNSRAGLKTLKKLEGFDQINSNQIDWESSRTAVLPWIKNLTPTQILELRDSASKAMPQFREFMTKSLALNADPHNADSEKKYSELILELRSQALEVKSELDAINIGSEKVFHNVGGALGLSIGIYSAAAMNPAIGLSTLIATLGLIHTNLKKDHTEVQKLSAKPGYVLVKAKEILEHAP